MLKIKNYIFTDIFNKKIQNVLKFRYGPALQTKCGSISHKLQSTSADLFLQQTQLINYAIEGKFVKVAINY